LSASLIGSLLFLYPGLIPTRESDFFTFFFSTLSPLKTTSTSLPPFSPLPSVRFVGFFLFLVMIISYTPVFNFPHFPTWPVDAMFPVCPFPKLLAWPWVLGGPLQTTIPSLWGHSLGPKLVQVVCPQFFFGFIVFVRFYFLDLGFWDLHPFCFSFPPVVVVIRVLTLSSFPLPFVPLGPSTIYLRVPLRHAQGPLFCNL